MKLKWRLDLNTIVLMLIFSGILYIHFTKPGFFEGFTTVSDVLNAISEGNTKLEDYKKNKEAADSLVKEIKVQEETVRKKESIINDTERQIYTTTIMPNLSVMKTDLLNSQMLLNELNRKITDIKTKMSLESTDNSYLLIAIEDKIVTQNSTIAGYRTQLTDLIKFSIDNTVAINGGATITIINSNASPQPTYTITSNPTVANLRTTIDSTSQINKTIITVNGLTANTSYTFTVKGDYGNSILYSAITSPVTPNAIIVPVSMPLKFNFSYSPSPMKCVIL